MPGNDHLTKEQCIQIMQSIDGLIAVDDKGFIIYMDSKIAAGMGLTVDECIGKYCRDILPLTNIYTTLETGRSEIGDVYYIDEDDHYQHPIVVSTRHPMQENGKLLGAVEYDIFDNDDVLASFINRMDDVLKKISRSINITAGRYTIDNLVGDSPAIKSLRKQIFLAAGNNAPVVISGETGSGKELVAQSIHRLSARKSKDFVAVNCSAIPTELFESEMFGYEHGAFTGARSNGKIGKFELAKDGTLFLDEINTLPMMMQPKILRAIQEKEIDRVGGTYPIKADPRIICATNQDLRTLIREGQFREDLFYRLNVFEINIKPLRERLEDIPELTESLVAKYNQNDGRRVRYIDPKVYDLLRTYSWPGNIRELQNAVERALLNLDAYEETLTVDSFEPFSETSIHELVHTDTYKSTLHNEEKKLITNVLKSVGWNKSKASKILGISRTTLYRKIRQFNINH